MLTLREGALCEGICISLFSFLFSLSAKRSTSVDDAYCLGFAFSLLQNGLVALLALRVYAYPDESLQSCGLTRTSLEDVRIFSLAPASTLLLVSLVSAVVMSRPTFKNGNDNYQHREGEKPGGWNVFKGAEVRAFCNLYLFV